MEFKTFKLIEKIINAVEAVDTPDIDMDIEINDYSNMFSITFKHVYPLKAENGKTNKI